MTAPACGSWCAIVSCAFLVPGHANGHDVELAPLGPRGI